MARIQTLTDLAAWQSVWSDLSRENAPVRLVFKRSPT